MFGRVSDCQFSACVTQLWSFWSGSSNSAVPSVCCLVDPQPEVISQSQEKN